MIEDISLGDLANWGNYILNTSWQKIYKVVTDSGTEL